MSAKAPGAGEGGERRGRVGKESSMSAKAPGAGEGGERRGRVGKEWTTLEPNSENKLVRVSGGTSRACFFRRN